MWGRDSKGSTASFRQSSGRVFACARDGGRRSGGCPRWGVASVDASGGGVGPLQCWLTASTARKDSALGAVAHYILLVFEFVESARSAGRVGGLLVWVL